jgi:hypothetical protein
MSDPVRSRSDDDVRGTPRGASSAAVDERQIGKHGSSSTQPAVRRSLSLAVEHFQYRQPRNRAMSQAQTSVPRVSAFPDADQELLLKSALLPEIEARKAWSQWREHRRGSPTKGVRWIAGLICRNLGAVAGDLHLAELAAIARSEALRIWRADADLAAALRAIQNRGISVMLLKGAAIGHFAYDEAALRPRSDSDVLVPTSRVFEALQALRDAGMVAESAPSSQGDLRWFHSCVLRSPSGTLLDLHWHLLSSSCSDRADEDFWAAARIHEWAGIRVLLLSPSDQLLHVLCHGLRWSSIRAPRWVADAVVLLRKEGTLIDWDRLDAQAASHRVLPAVREGLLYLHRNVPGVVPAEALWPQRFSRASRTDEWAYQARRLSPESRNLLDAAVLHIDEYRIRMHSGAVAQGFAGFALTVGRTWGIRELRRLPTAAVQRMFRRGLSRAVSGSGRASR